MQVQLFKKLSDYVNANGEARTAINFYIKCGDSLIPIEIRYFQGQEGIDPNYRGRKMVLSSFAEEIINDNKNQGKSQSSEKGEKGENLEVQNP